MGHARSGFKSWSNLYIIFVNSSNRFYRLPDPISQAVVDWVLYKHSRDVIVHYFSDRTDFHPKCRDITLQFFTVYGSADLSQRSHSHAHHTLLGTYGHHWRHQRTCDMCPSWLRAYASRRISISRYWCNVYKPFAQWSGSI